MYIAGNAKSSKNFNVGQQDSYKWDLLKILIFLFYNCNMASLLAEFSQNITPYCGDKKMSTTNY